MTQTHGSTMPILRRNHLQEARELHSLSQQEVAERIDTTGLNVSRWERGITRPGPYFRAKLCQLFGKSERELDLDESLYDSSIPLRPTTRLVGREDELAQLKQRLFAGSITALNGLPGVGKTAIAIELAYDPDIRTHFRDGILWTALGSEPSVPAILIRWGTLLGIEAAAVISTLEEEWYMAVRSAIGSHSMLLVIDDVWYAEDALALTAGGPNCAHLVTTRFPGVATEIAGEGATVIRELKEHEGMTLLRMLAPRVVDHEEQKALDLVNAVGGLPLALTLMGKYLHAQASTGQSWHIAAALARLSRAEERLQLRELPGPHDHHPGLPTEPSPSLQSVFAIAGQQLDNETRAALAALSVFPPKPNSFSEEAALAVAGCTVNTLDALLDTGLLESSAPGCYTLHQTVADYARLCCLTETEVETQSLRRRFG